MIYLPSVTLCGLTLTYVCRLGASINMIEPILYTTLLFPSTTLLPPTPRAPALLLSGVVDNAEAMMRLLAKYNAITEADRASQQGQESKAVS